MPYFLLATLIAFSIGNESRSEGIHFTHEEDGVSVYINEQLFTRYLMSSGTKPVLWPIIGPTNKPMTRAYPIAPKEPNEATDHIHHRSLWIGYEGINNVDFWHESRKGNLDVGKTVHVQFQLVESIGDTGKIIAANDWVDSQGDRVCSDLRTLEFGYHQDQRWIDFQLELIASEGQVTLGDSKEGFFAVRVAPTIKVDADKGGEIVNSRGDVNRKAWSQHAKWVDYHGTVGNETLGIAILSHPGSFEPIPRWHVRTYGLFASNPFGELAFTNPDSAMASRPARHTIPAGESITFRYKIILHKGNEKEAKIADSFNTFSSQ